MHRRMPGRRVLAGAITVVALALTALGAAVTAHPAAAVVGDCSPGSDWGTSRPDLASSVVSLINGHRTSMGLVSLSVSPTLTQAAVWKALHMARYSYMAHDDPAPPVARTPADRLEACGYPSRTTGWGENIAYGYSTPASVVDAWLNSPGHRANIENASYRSTGVGAASNASGVLYWSQEFGTYDDSGSTGGGGGVSAPTVSLTSGPASSTTSTSASFGWSTTGTVSSTTCSLDGAAAVSCASPKSYSGLATGAHSFRVTVSNSAGSASASYTWNITATPPPPTSAPTVSLTSGPSASTASTSASFGWSTTGTVSSTTCSLDGAAAVSCTSPTSYTGLASGSHSFRVTVANAAGGASASYTWTVTTTAPPPTTGAPLISLTSAPARLTSSHSATFAWVTSGGSVTSTKCSLDYGTAVSCTSPWQASNLLRGSHRFTVTVSGPGGSATAVTTWYIYA